MKIVKGVFTYILIFLGIILAAGILLFTSMAFLKFEVFGMNVIMHNETRDWSSRFGFNDSPFKGWTAMERDIYINSNGYDVVIRPWDESVKNNKHAAIRVTDNGFGLSTNSVKNASVSVYYKQSYNDVRYVTAGTNAEVDERASAPVVIIDVKTPQGLISYKNSRVEVVLPWVSGFGYNLHINSGKGDINIIPTVSSVDHKEELGNMPIKSLYLTTDTGNVSVRGLTENGAAHPISNMVLNTNKGKFDFSEQNFEVSNSVKINSTRGDFKFKNITGEFVIKGENLVLKADKIVTNNKQFLYNCPNGTITIEELNVGKSVTFIVTEYARVSITKLVGDTSIQATYGDTYIGNTVANVVDVTTTNGNITIDNTWVTNCKYNETTGKWEAINDGYCKGTVALRSTYGDITIGEYRGNAWVTNNRGKITINQSQNSYDNDIVEETKIETERGEVKATGLTDKVIATATGSANMTLSYYRLDADVTCESKITIGSGQLNLNVPTHTAQTAEFAVKVEAIKDGGKVIMKSAGSVNNEYSNLDNLTNGYAKGDSNKKIEFHITVNGGKAVFDEFAQQY